MGKATQRRIDILFWKENEMKLTKILQQQHLIVCPCFCLNWKNNSTTTMPDNQMNLDNQMSIFWGVEFLQRDPGLRPQIWQFPPEQKDTVRRAYLSLGPMQPHLQYYKLSSEQGHRRRFQYSWFGLFPSWLEYSEDKKSAYCLFCFVSSRFPPRCVCITTATKPFCCGCFQRWRVKKYININWSLSMPCGDRKTYYVQSDWKVAPVSHYSSRFYGKCGTCIF